MEDKVDRGVGWMEWVAWWGGWVGLLHGVDVKCYSIG